MQKHICIGEKHILGSRTRFLVVRADESDDRAWLRRAKVCPSLAEHQIAHCGVMYAKSPLEIVRLNLSGAFFLACLAGTGRVLVDGKWRQVKAGTACMQPPFITNALKAERKGVWTFCWIRYREASWRAPCAVNHSPTIGPFNGVPLNKALEGLNAAAAADLPLLRQHWTDLVHGYVQAFASRGQEDSRMTKLWEAVEQKLYRDWNLEELASLADLSKEHLRRLTYQWIGRAPMQHLAYLRMRHAAEMLATTSAPIATVAEEVGYSNPFAFSDAFQKWMHFRPSVYRQVSAAGAELDPQSAARR